MSGAGKPTPGPWRVGPAYDGEFHDIERGGPGHPIICGVEGHADAALIAAAPDLFAACVEAALWFGPFTTARFEEAAERFYRETGYMAPGKDVAAAMSKSNEWHNERQPAWQKWSAAQVEAARVALGAAIAKAVNW